MLADWGTDHWYETDGYFDQQQGPWLRRAPREPGTAPWARAEEVPADPAAFAHARAAYTSMNATDPHAVWFYQGWIWPTRTTAMRLALVWNRRSARLPFRSLRRPYARALSNF